MSKRIYEKTDKGREEIATRKHQMAARLRPLLVIIDGRQSVTALTPHLARLGLDQTSFDELIEQGYIQVSPLSEPEEVPVVHVPRVPPGLRRAHKLHGEGAHPAPVKLVEIDLVSVNGVIDIAPEPAAPVAVASSAVVEMHPDDAERFKAVHRFFNETIRGNLGLRGFSLQLKVERADTLDDLRALRQPYLEAIKKLQGMETAKALDARLMSLLEEKSVA